jgi:phosphatidylinositol alpha-mannosyltransferase
MKIGFVFDDTLDNPDGIQQYMASLAAYYTSVGHEVHYLVGATTRTDIPHVHSMSRNVKVQFNGNRLSIPLWAPLKRVRAVLETEKFDVLHVQVPYHPLMAGRIVKAAPRSTVVFGTFHVAPYSKLATAGSWLLGRWSRWSGSLGRFDKMVSVSPAALHLAKETFGLSTEVVPNVFDYPRFNQAKPLPQYDDNKKTIVFLGRLVKRKGCLTLLQAVYRLVSDGRQYPAFRVVVCGGGPLESALRDYVTRNKLNDIVEFAGRVSERDKPRYFASADIAAFPSSSGESFGIVLLEAMASGNAAVLGGDNPGYRSVLGARPAQLFNAKDPAALADKLSERLMNESLLVADAQWGMAESEQYDAATVGAKLLTMYKQVAPNSNSES